MIVKILFENEKGEREAMLFGNSYKTWQNQYSEYARRFPTETAIQAWKSKSKWKGFGGLKWCLDENFQEELNREGCQIEDPDNPKPRQYSKMKFLEFYVRDLPDKYKH